MRRMQPKQQSRALVQQVVLGVVLGAAALSTWMLAKLRSKQSARTVELDAYVDITPSSKDASRRDKEITEAAKKLKALYEKMSVDFETGGLNLAAIESMLPWFHGVTNAEDTPWPKKYLEFAEPLPADAVRLLVIPLEYSPELGTLGSAITQSVMRVLPAGTKVFTNARNYYHCTVFHTSHPSDTRADATKPNGDVDLQVPPAQRRGPTSFELQHESELVKQAVQSTAPPVLQVDRVVMANSGTLLITWIDLTDNVSQLRAKCHAAFPGASSRQATIIHTSLLRIVSPVQLSQTDIQAVQHVCKTWTQKLQGKVYTPKGLWFVRESEFSTIVGDKQTFLLRQ